MPLRRRRRTKKASFRIKPTSGRLRRRGPPRCARSRRSRGRSLRCGRRRRSGRSRRSGKRRPSGRSRPSGPEEETRPSAGSSTESRGPPGERSRGRSGELETGGAAAAPSAGAGHRPARGSPAARRRRRSAAARARESVATARVGPGVGVEGAPAERAALVKGEGAAARAAKLARKNSRRSQNCEKWPVELRSQTTESSSPDFTRSITPPSLLRWAS
mmetsp:Transcript_33425/g.92353  ORF Transcript_33425/g.92353 Transcript_33425/m.92353 type:complete len:217 (+) Transcript_33425:1125-1775(+)